MHCSLNINDSFEVDKRVVMWPFNFFLRKGYVDGALFTIIVKKNDMQTYFNVDEGKLRKSPLVFQWNS